MVYLLASHTTVSTIAVHYSLLIFEGRQTQSNIVMKVYSTPDKALKLCTYITNLTLILIIDSSARTLLLRIY